MRVLVSGATGFIGSALVASLRAEGHTVHRVVRRSPGPGDALWSGSDGGLDLSRLPGATLDGLDAAVHLAGESIAGGRWTARRREELLESRTATTRALAGALAACDRPPAVLVSGSAVGFYGSRADEWLDEGSPAGDGFLAELCRRWEEATSPAVDAGIRVVRLRTGIVLGPGGGALAPMLRLFRSGLGGRLGSGRQWTSWISLEDQVAVIAKAITDEALVGPVNATAPQPVTNGELTRALGRAVSRPAFLRVPATALRLVLGRELADQLLLASQRVRPLRLEAAGYPFIHPTIDEALRVAVGSRR
jgi:uncharacterized protein (TIGR01777 family)